MLRAMICLFLWSTALGATTFTIPSLENMFPTDAEILHLRIEEGKAHNYVFEGRHGVCGISYRASVIERILGTGDFDELVFQSSTALRVSREYIVFVGKLRKELPPGQKVVSKPHIFPYIDSDQFKMCRNEILPELIGDTAFEFEATIRNEKGNLEWLVKEYSSLHIPQRVRTSKVKCVPEDNDETTCDLVGQPVLIHWPSLRLYIEEQQLNSKDQ